MNAAASAAAGPPAPPTPLCQPEPWPPRALLLPVGETMRYLVEVDGLSVGTLDFQVLPAGPEAGQEVRAVLGVDPLAASLLPARGRAAARLDAQSGRPLRAFMELSEGQRQAKFAWEFAAAGRPSRASATTPSQGRRHLVLPEQGPMLDLLTTFYSLRQLAGQRHACIRVAAGVDVARLELTFASDELRRTPVGMRPSSRWQLRWASRPGARHATAGSGQLWTSQETGLPLEADMRGRRHLRAVLSTYQVPAGAAPPPAALEGRENPASERP